MTVAQAEARLHVLTAELLTLQHPINRRAYGPGVEQAIKRIQEEIGEVEGILAAEYSPLALGAGSDFDV